MAGARRQVQESTYLAAPGLSSTFLAPRRFRSLKGYACDRYGSNVAALKRALALRTFESWQLKPVKATPFFALMSRAMWYFTHEIYFS